MFMPMYGMNYADFSSLAALPYEMFSSSSSEKDFKASDSQLPRPLSNSYEFTASFTPLGQLPPIPDSLYAVTGQGVASPRHLRLTLNAIPADASMLSKTGLPFAAVWQPLAELGDQDDKIPVIPHVPARCLNCFAYFNSFFEFIRNSRKVKCNICNSIQEVPEIYNAQEGFEELKVGSYEFKATAEYSNRPAQSFLYLFCIDVSATATEFGLLTQAVSSIRSLIDFIEEPERKSIGILTYDEAIHIYTVSPYGTITETIINDPNDPFIPHPVNSCCFNLSSNREGLETLLNYLQSSQFTPSKEVLSIGSILSAVNSTLLKSRGGRVVIFKSKSDTTGLHKLESQSKPEIVHSTVEKSYTPDDTYLLLAQECSREDVCVDLFICTNFYVCMPSLAVLCKLTGGDLYYFPGYKAENDAERLYYYIARLLTRNQVTQVSMRVRCSNGISVDYYVGKFTRKGPVEMEVPYLDADKSFCIALNIDEKLTEGKNFYLQCAMLYTDSSLNRVLRVFNTRFEATRNLLTVFKNADVDAIANSMLRLSANSIFSQSLIDIRERLQSSLLNMMASHRESAADHNYSKVSLPDSLRYLIAYYASMLKLPALTIATINIEARAYSIAAILSMPVLNTRLLLYPKVFQLKSLESERANDSGYLIGRLKLLPPKLSALCSDEVYLINNGDIIMIFVGKKSDAMVQQIWAVNNSEELLNQDSRGLFTDSPLSCMFRQAIEEIRALNPGGYSGLYYTIEGQTSGFMLNRLMVEDASSIELSYNDIISRLHKIIMNKHSN